MFFVFIGGGGGLSPPQLLNTIVEHMYFQISAFALSFGSSLVVFAVLSQLR
jgi:hypothetical protein